LKTTTGTAAAAAAAAAPAAAAPAAAAAAAAGLGCTVLSKHNVPGHLYPPCEEAKGCYRLDFSPTRTPAPKTMTMTE
jgi:hypothetical protein